LSSCSRIGLFLHINHHKIFAHLKLSLHRRIITWVFIDHDGPASSIKLKTSALQSIWDFRVMIRHYFVKMFTPASFEGFSPYHFSSLLFYYLSFL
jgi:hypothetical protein